MPTLEIISGDLTMTALDYDILLINNSAKSILSILSIIPKKCWNFTSQFGNLFTVLPRFLPRVKSANVFR